MKTTENKIIIEITCLQKDELPQLAPLCHLLGFEGDLINLEERFFNLLKFPAHQVRVARTKKNTNIIGFIHFFEAPSLLTNKTIEIGGLAVTPEYRGLGVGSQLMLEVEKWAEQKECKSILLATQVMRTEAIIFYEHLGFHKEFKTYFMRKNFN